MTPHSSHSLNGPAQTLSGAVVFTKQLLLPETSSASGASHPSGSSLKDLTARANRMTAILRTFEGYSHSGLNE